MKIQVQTKMCSIHVFSGFINNKTSYTLIVHDEPYKMLLSNAETNCTKV